MSEIILDFGSGNTCKNSRKYIKKMYDELKKVDSGKHKVIVKWQLFDKAGINIPLTKGCFEYAYNYGRKLGYEVTASVIDKKNLDYLLGFDIPFVKIKNDRMLDWLIDYIPDNMSIYISMTEPLFIPNSGMKNITYLWCISNYPATIESYEKLPLTRGCNISDHTEDFTLFNKYMAKISKCQIIEWHYKLKDSVGLDAGLFARTPEMLADIL